MDELATAISLAQARVHPAWQARLVTLRRALEAHFPDVGDISASARSRMHADGTLPVASVTALKGVAKFSPTPRDVRLCLKASKLLMLSKNKEAIAPYPRDIRLKILCGQIETVVLAPPPGLLEPDGSITLKKLMACPRIVDASTDIVTLEAAAHLSNLIAVGKGKIVLLDEAAQISRQVEFWFGASNWTTDTLLQELERDNDGYVPLDEVLRFPRLRRLGATASSVAAALSSSTIVRAMCVEGVWCLKRFLVPGGPLIHSAVAFVKPTPAASLAAVMEFLFCDKLLLHKYGVLASADPAGWVPVPVLCAQEDIAFYASGGDAAPAIRLAASSSPLLELREDGEAVRRADYEAVCATLPRRLWLSQHAPAVETDSDDSEDKVDWAGLELVPLLRQASHELEDHIRASQATLPTIGVYDPALAAPVDFTAMSYNILAEGATMSKFSYASDSSMDWRRRRVLLMAEVTAQRPSILCMQEVQSLLPPFSEKEPERNHVAYFERELGALGYGAAYTRKMGTRYAPMQPSKPVIGNALFWDTRVFTQEGEIGHISLATAGAEMFPQPSVKGEMGSGTQELQRVWAASDCDALVLCGDFNSTPTTAAYEYMTKGRVSDTHPVHQIAVEAGCDMPPVPDCPFLVTSAYTAVTGREPPYTVFSHNWGACLDYVFFSNKAEAAVRVRAARVLEMPTQASVAAHTGLPSPMFPSDHMSVAAGFTLS